MYISSKEKKINHFLQNFQDKITKFAPVIIR